MTPTRFPIVLLRPLGQLSVKCESQYTRGIAKCKQKSWHFLKRATPQRDSGDQKRPLASIVIYGKLFKIGIYKLLDNEFKNPWPMLRTTGMHFASTTLHALTCDLPNLSPRHRILPTDPSSSWSGFGWNTREVSCKHGHMWRS